MDPITGFVIGGVLIVWLGILATILFNSEGKVPTSPGNLYVLLPVGVALSVWMWIFAIVVLNN